MKLTKSQLKQMIKEELTSKVNKINEALDTKATQTAAGSAKAGRMAAGDQGQVTNQERAALDHINSELKQLAKEKNMLSGTVLAKINQLLDVIKQARGDTGGPETEETEDLAGDKRLGRPESTSTQA
jgi:hypothetical protein